MTNLLHSAGKLCILSLFAACFAWGQATNSSEVTGSVTDPTGAIVPGVTVTVKDIDKNTERTFTTNDSGVYDTGPLVPVLAKIVVGIRGSSANEVTGCPRPTST